MERIVLYATSVNASDLAYIEVAAFEDGAGDPELKGSFTGDLYSEGTLYVGHIETVEKWRQQGVASRLLEYAVRVYRLSTVQAGTISATADRLFEKLDRSFPDLEVIID